MGAGSEGPVACAPGAGLVVLASAQTGLVRTFSPDGALAWSRQLSGFVPLAYRFLPNGVQWLPNPKVDGAHFVLSMAVLPPDRLLVQMRLSPMIQGREDGPLETRVLSLGDGREIARVPGLPLIREVRPPLALGYENDPLPRFLVLSSDDLLKP